MKNNIKIFIWSSIALAIINILWLVSCIYCYHYVPLTRNLSPLTVLKIFGSGVLFSAVTHLLIFTGAIIHIRRSRKYYTGGIMLVAAGMISFVLLFFLWAGVHDYLTDTSAKLNALYFIQFYQLVFYVFAIIYFFLLARLGDPDRPAAGIRNEQLFMMMNISGIICSVAGIIMIRLLYFFYGGRLHGSDITPFIFIMVPWLLIFVLWLTGFVRDKHSGRYDEKLATDINKTGMFVFLLSIILVSVMTVKSFLGVEIYRHYFINGRMDILWLPLYAFIAMLIFSLVAIYNFKQN